jgi:hypothetical protein
MIARDPAARAIGRLVDMRDELEHAARADGEIILITRRQYDRLINHIDATGRFIREREERP